MPPKKNNDKTPGTAKKSEPKIQKTNLKKEKKPPLKTPTVIRTKLKIPGKKPVGLFNENIPLKKLPISERTQARLDLANEVASLQLVKLQNKEVPTVATQAKPKVGVKKGPTLQVKKNGIKGVAQKRSLVRKKNAVPMKDDMSGSTDDNTTLKILKETEQAGRDLENEVAKSLLVEGKEEVPPPPKARGRKKPSLQVTLNINGDAVIKKKRLVRVRRNNIEPDMFGSTDDNTTLKATEQAGKDLEQAGKILENEVAKSLLLEGKEEVSPPKARGRKKPSLQVTVDVNEDAVIKKKRLVRRRNVELEAIGAVGNAQLLQGLTTRRSVYPISVKTEDPVNVEETSESPAKTLPTPRRGRTAQKIDPVKGEETSETPAKTLPTPRRGRTAQKKEPTIQTETTDKKPKSTRILRQPAKIQTKKQSKPEATFQCDSPIKQRSEAITSPPAQSMCSSEISCLSWTKDISISSDTTTCITVGANDFVCIDKKLPIIQLSHIDINKRYSKVDKNAIENNKRQSLSDTGTETDRRDSEGSSSPGSSSSSSSRSASSLKLSSTSSSRTGDMTSKQNTTEPNNNMTYEIDKTTAKLNVLDLDFVDWIGKENENDDSNTEKFQEILKVLKYENDIIIQCNNLQRILNDDIYPDEEAEMYKDDDDNDDVFVKPRADASKYVSDKSEDDEIFKSRESKNKSLDETYESKGDSPSLKSLVNADDNLECEARRISIDRNYNDDDDALSLYAESFTMESSRISTGSVPQFDRDLNSEMNSKIEEYVPEPITKSAQSMSYNPTKIIESVPKTIEGSKTFICEKQNADSTSIYRDTEQYKVPCNYPSTSNFVTQNIPKEVITPKIAHREKLKGCLVASSYLAVPGVRSNVFRGVCFFNLINSCKKNQRCFHPHLQIELPVIKNRLLRLSEEQFIQEYMLMRMWPCLRRRYGMLFLDECVHRELIRLLIEMALDFVMKANVNSLEDNKLKIQVVEQTLIYLNQKDLTAFHDLLTYNLGDNVLLCDVFIKSIADTQNFSRFKQVFTNLTNFMVDNKRKFSLDVASHILERVCILPCDELLYRTMLKILINTDSVIFGDPMMMKFEQNVSQFGSDLHGEYLLSKGTNLEMSAFDSLKSPFKCNQVPEQIMNPIVQTVEAKRYTSPDTTNMDNLNKPLKLPLLTRTIVNHSVTSTNDPQADPGAPSPVFHPWENKTVFRNPSWSGPTKRVKRNMYGCSPPKFPRRSGPDYL